MSTATLQPTPSGDATDSGTHSVSDNDDTQTYVTHTAGDPYDEDEEDSSSVEAREARQEYLRKRKLALEADQTHAAWYSSENPLYDPTFRIPESKTRGLLAGLFEGNPMVDKCMQASKHPWLAILVFLLIVAALLLLLILPQIVIVAFYLMLLINRFQWDNLVACYRMVKAHCLGRTWDTQARATDAAASILDPSNRIKLARAIEEMEEQDAQLTVSLSKLQKGEEKERESLMQLKMKNLEALAILKASFRLQQPAAAGPVPNESGLPPVVDDVVNEFQNKMIEWGANAFLSYALLFFFWEPRVGLMRCWMVLQVLSAWIVITGQREKNAVFFLSVLGWLQQVYLWSDPSASWNQWWATDCRLGGKLEWILICGTILIYLPELWQHATRLRRDIEATIATLVQEKVHWIHACTRLPALAMLLHSVAHLSVVALLLQPQWIYLYVTVLITTLWAYWQLWVHTPPSNDHVHMWTYPGWFGSLVVLLFLGLALYLHSFILLLCHISLFLVLFLLPSIAPTWFKRAFIEVPRWGLRKLKQFQQGPGPVAPAAPAPSDEESKKSN